MTLMKLLLNAKKKLKSRRIIRVGQILMRQEDPSINTNDAYLFQTQLSFFKYFQTCKLCKTMRRNF